MIKTFSFTLIAAIAVLFVVLVIRAGTFKSRQLSPEPAESTAISRAAALAHLSAAIQLKTVSMQTPAANAGAFIEFHALIARAFPRISRQLHKETVGEHSLLFTWQGNDDRLKPMLLMRIWSTEIGRTPEGCRPQSLELPGPHAHRHR